MTPDCCDEEMSQGVPGEPAMPLTSSPQGKSKTGKGGSFALSIVI